jgi:hypothetical protein
MGTGKQENFKKNQLTAIAGWCGHENPYPIRVRAKQRVGDLGRRERQPHERAYRYKRGSAVVMDKENEIQY